jgi:hypothetical protein
MFDQMQIQQQADLPVPTAKLGSAVLRSSDFYFGYFYFAYARASGRCSTPGRSCQK